MKSSQMSGVLTALLMLLTAAPGLAQPASATVAQALVAMTQADAVEVATALKEEILQGRVAVETRERRIVVRLKVDDAFPQGQATLRPSYKPVVERVRNAIQGLTGEVAVEGHTDDVPIATARFRSSWELASAQAVAVAHELMRGIDPARIVVKAYGPTRPLVANDTDAHRAHNRRVDIVIEQGLHDDQYLSGKVPLPGQLTWPAMEAAPATRTPDQDFF